MQKYLFFVSVTAVLFTGDLRQSVQAGNWPMVGADAARSGYSKDALPAKLFPQWAYKSAHAPVRAWPRDDRMLFDAAYHVAVADGTLYFGSSADDKVTALDAATGKEKWTFFTGAPVRFAPAVWKDRLFVGSDDGHFYCLSTADGSVIRSWRGGPNDDLVLGNGRIVSKWPVRGGPVIVDDVVYFAAGIWQSEGVYIYAIDPESGKIVWTNNSSGGIYMPQPHSGANAKSGVSAQGYLMANADQLFVPTGRAVPASFNRANGKFQYYHLQKNPLWGGSQTITAGPFFYNAGGAFEAKTGVLRESRFPGAVAAFTDGVVNAYSNELRGLRWVEKNMKDRKGNPITVPAHEQLWKIGDVAGGTSLIVAGNTAVSAGDRTLHTVDIESRKRVWSHNVDGTAYGLAAADGRLYVSTSKGTIYCFAGNYHTTLETNQAKTEESPYGSNETYRRAAEEIINKSGVTEGYCVDVGCGNGALAYELARRTKLHIVAIDSDPKNVAEARRNLDKARLYGVRVSVHLGDPKKTNFPKYFANLVVSGRSVSGTADLDSKELFRLQRPYGGIACLGKPGQTKLSKRSALKTAGSWTHLYSNPANTLCSSDEVKGPLSVLWFRDVDLELPQRHGRGPSPLFSEGRIFAEGMDALRAVDAYNGHTLWEFELEGILRAYNADHILGTAGTGSNFCVAEGSVYVRKANACFRLDAATGKELGRFEVPHHADGTPGLWGYIACVDGILYGSIVNEKHIVRHTGHRADDSMRQLFTESTALFAMDAKTGKLLWRYDANESIRHNAIAIGDGRVFLIDRALALGDLLSRATDRRRARRGKSSDLVEASIPHRGGELVSLDAKTGKVLLTADDDIFGTMLIFSQEYDILILCYQSTEFRLPSEVGGRMAAFRASDGYRVWDKKVLHNTRPLVNDRTIIAMGGSWDLLTGEKKSFDLKKTYGCGQISASKNLMLFRSGTLGYFDFTRKEGVENFGGIRPGCWVNALPVGGLVLVPDASAGCLCSYQNRSWVALEGVD